MPNTGDFDPAEAIRQQRAAEEAEKQRFQAQRDRERAKVLKLLRYAEDQLEEIRNPVVSEFVVTERWWTPEPKWISSRNKRADQDVIRSRVVGIFTNREQYEVAKRHERQTHYYGSWLWLISVDDGPKSEMTRRSGLVKLRQPRTGYAYTHIKYDWDPRNVSCIDIDLTDRSGREISQSSGQGPYFRIFASPEEAPFTPAYGWVEGSSDTERLTTAVRQALDFVATGKVFKPEGIEMGW